MCGDFIAAAKEYRRPAYCIFAATRKTFVHEQELYISDTCTEFNYRITHPKNKGAEKAGTVRLDMGEFIKSDVIQSTEKEDAIKSKEHYRDDFDLVLKVKGRNLEIEVCAAGKSLAIGSKESRITANFIPETK